MFRQSLQLTANTTLYESSSD